MSGGTPSDRLRGPLRELAALAGELRRMPREQRAARPRPPETGLVVDLGAGHAPFPRADVIVDKYVTDDFERGSSLAAGKPLVVGDGQALPFGDNTVDYLIAAHVLEHATDPVRFAGELSRAARGGFVQTPTRLAEQVFGWPFHPWLIDREGDALVFSPKPWDGELTTALHDLYASSGLFRLFFFAHRSAFHHSVHWQGALPVRVHGESAAAQTAQIDLEAALSALRRMSPPPLPASVRAALRCPACHGRLTDGRGVLVCSDCERAYPVVGTVPVLLLDAVAAEVRG